MTPHQLQCLNDDYNNLRPISSLVASRFYRRLFELAPDARGLFHSTQSDQVQMLMSALSTIVSGNCNQDGRRSYLEGLARRHQTCGVRRRHVFLAKQALLETLKITLCEQYTYDSESAWSEATGNIFECFSIVLDEDC